MTEVIGVIAMTCRSILAAKKFYLAKNLAISIGISLERLALIDTLKHSEKRYKDLFEKAVDGIFIINLQGKFVDGNQAALRISGYKREELVGKLFHQIIAPPYIKSTSEAVDNLIEGKEDYIQQELEIINKDEHYVPLEVRATLIKNKGQPIAIQGIFRDITERKQMEQALKQSEARYCSLFKHSVDAIFVCDFHGKLIDVNQAVCQLTGYTKDELLTMSIPDLHEEEDLEAYNKYFKRIIAGEPIISQAKILRKDGKKVPCEFNSSVIDTAQAIIFHSIARDLSERQKAEQEIHQGYQIQNVLNKLLSLSLKDLSLKEMLNRILQQLLSISWLALESKGAIFLVEQDSDTLAMKAQHSLPKSIRSLCKRVPFGRCLCGQAASSGKIIFKNKIDQPMDNNDFSPHGHYCVPIISTRKKVLGVICLFLKQDHYEDKKEEEFLETVANVIAGIIERKRAEEAVRESEEKYSTLVEEGNDGIVIIQDNQLKYVNSKMSEIIGASVQELIGTSFVDYIPPKLKSFIKDRISRRISGEKVPGKYEIEILNKSGKKIPVEVNASLIQYKGRPADMAIVRDITERKHTEEVLRENEERYRKMFESMSDSVAILEAVGNGKDFIFKEINKAAEETERIVKEEVIGKSIHEVFPSVKDFGLFGVLQRVWRTGKPEHHPISFYEDKRISGWRENYVYKLPSGEVVSIYEDVTRRKNLQDAILKMYLELSTLNTIISSVSRTLSLEEVLHVSLENTSIAAEWDGGCISILEKKEGQGEVIIPYSTKGISKQFKQKIINDTSLCEVFFKLKKLIKKEGIKSLVLVPLKVKDRLIGLIVGINKRIKKISHDNLALLSSIGQQVGIAIENAQLYKRIKESEERYRAIFENSQLGIYITTPEGKFKACNQALAKIDGYSSPEELMESYLEKNIYVHPEDMKRLRSKLNSEGYISNYEIDYRRRDGKIITCLETAVAIKDESGKIIEYHGTILDISQRKKLREELKKSEEKYHTIFDNVPVTIFLIDAEGKVADVNKYHVENMMKNLMSKEEYIGRHILDYEFIKETEVREKTIELLKGKNFYVREAYLADSYKGGAKYYNIQGTPLFTNGKVTGAIILLADVTDLKKLQMELMQSEKLSALGEMISGVAHELNNPLTSVLGYSQLFQQYDVSEDLKEDLNKIRSEAERCHRIVQSLLRFARRHKPGKIYTNINEVIENTLELMAYELKVNNIEVIKELDMNLPFTMVDPYQLQQVLLNLINNAYHAMITDKGKGRLVVKSCQSQQKIIISVIDNGAGISAENLPKIFDPFFSTKESGEGTGLGLSLSYGIIKEHQGEISVESKLGKGSTFIVTLPIIDYPLKKETEKSPDIVKKKPEGARILVVEDEEILRSLILQLLKREGYKVSLAENGNKALEMINQNNYNAIISDIKMPRLSGKEFYKKLKKQQPELAERVIFLTGDVLNTNTNQFLSQLEDRYLTKPFNNEHLLNLIAEVINKNERI
jgi:PAS domain S-box-containing protein